MLNGCVRSTDFGSRSRSLAEMKGIIDGQKLKHDKLVLDKEQLEREIVAVAEEGGRLGVDLAEQLGLTKRVEAAETSSRVKWSALTLELDNASRQRSV